MPISFDFTTSDPSTYTVTGSAPRQKVIDTATDAARYLYPIKYQLYDANDEPISFDALTLIQKKAIIAYAFRDYLLDCAKSYHAVTAANTARDAAIAEGEDKYGLQ